MEDFVMVSGIAIFGLLLMFLIFISIVVIFSDFKKIKRVDFEPKVSIIIPCYNEEENIAECLDSIFSVNYPKEKLEVIVVDDGSVDSTLSILEEYRKKFVNLIVLKNKHSGKSDCLNRGVLRASNEFVITLDADTTIDKDSIRRLVMPFANRRVGAANGSYFVKNRYSVVGLFQDIEYCYNNLVRKGFSDLFGVGVWFFGAFACYRKRVLEEIGYFKKDSMTEDMDTALEILSYGYRVVNVYNAFGYTNAPSCFIGLIKQRIRWWIGVLQALRKNKRLFSIKSNESIIFLFINQYWWTIYAVIYLPILVYQFNYWLPSGAYEIFLYTIRWLSVWGPFYVIYKIPEWGFPVYSLFGVLAGIVNFFLILKALRMFKKRIGILDLAGAFFYFPYTIVLNTSIVISIIKLSFLKRKYFIY